MPPSVELQRLSQIDRQDLHRFAVLGHGAARDDDALLPQYFRNLAVGEWFARILRAYELLDEGADRRARGRPAALGTDVAAEEILQLEYSARGVHELLGGHARHGRFVQVERFGDLAQHERAHRNLA